jgi:hypothetical protein
MAAEFVGSEPCRPIVIPLYKSPVLQMLLTSGDTVLMYVHVHSAPFLDFITFSQAVYL